MISDLAISLDAENIKSYPFASDLDLALRDQDAFVGIEFEDYLRNIERIPSKLKVALRFPHHLRSMKNEIWPDKLIKQRNDYSKRDPYVEEGFLVIQIKLTEALLRAGNRSIEIPTVHLQPYPDRQHYIYTNLISAYQNFITVFPFLFMASSWFICKVSSIHKSVLDWMVFRLRSGNFEHFIRSILNFELILKLQKIVAEKKRESREMMRLMGLSIELNWVSWFIVSYILFAIPMLVIGFMMKIFMCPSSSVLILLIICLTYVFSLVCFIFMVTVFISSTFLSVVSMCICHMASFLPFYFAVEPSSRLQAIIVCCFLNSAMPSVMIHVLGFEVTGEGIDLFNLFSYPHPEDKISCGSILLLMWGTGAIRLLTCLYIDKLFPGKYGVHQKWYFPFVRKFWCPWKRPRFDGGNDDEELLISIRRNVLAYEEVVDNMVVVVELQHIRKDFHGNTAVHDFNLSLYDSEITVLLGHNGSGKSTILMMIAGIYAPTEGSIMINGIDATLYPELARSSLGLCMQHNIFFEELGAYWHIVFFSRVKGFSQQNAEAEAEKYLEKINLLDRAHLSVMYLPYTVRRKLALCCALCADTKVSEL